MRVDNYVRVHYYMIYMNDTIAAKGGGGGIGVPRISGQQAPG